MIHSTIRSAAKILFSRAIHRCIFSIGMIALATPSTTWACSCGVRHFQDPEGDLARATFIVDAVVESVKSAGRQDAKVGTLLVTKGWKGARDGERIVVQFPARTSCNAGPPRVGTKWSQAVFVSNQKGESFRPTCFGGVAPPLMERFSREREQLEARVRSTPDDFDAQFSLATFFNTWRESRLAVPLLQTLAQRAPENHQIQLELADALIAERRYAETVQPLRKALEAKEYRGRAELLSAKLVVVQDREKREKAAGLAFGTRSVAYMWSDLSDQSAQRMRLSDIILNPPLKARGGDWRGSRVVNVGLDYSDFSGANLTGVYFEKVSFNGANLAGVMANNSACNMCEFAGADLRAIAASGASLYGGRFQRADLGEANLVGADLRTVNFESAKLTNARLDRANLSEAILTNADFAGASMTGARLDGADLRGADLSHTKLEGASLVFARFNCETRFPPGFEREKFPMIPLAQCRERQPPDYSKIDFSFRELRIRPNFQGAYLVGATFNNPARELQFVSANLDDAKFVNLGLRFWLTGVSARNTAFENVSGALIVQNADLSGATFIGRDSPSAILKIPAANVRLDGARLSRVTIDIGPVFSLTEIIPEKFETTLEGARIEQSLIQCRSIRPEWRTMSDTRSEQERGRRRLVSEFIKELALAQKIAVSHPTNRITPECDKAISLYLSGACQAGRAAAKFDYPCPTNE